MIIEIPNILIPILIIASLWELAWKGVGMWRAGRNNQIAWFVCILIFNTLGILPVIYLLFFQKKESKVSKKPLKSKKKGRK